MRTLVLWKTLLRYVSFYYVWTELVASFKWDTQRVARAFWLLWLEMIRVSFDCTKTSVSRTLEGLFDFSMTKNDLSFIWLHKNKCVSSAYAGNGGGPPLENFLVPPSRSRSRGASLPGNMNLQADEIYRYTHYHIIAFYYLKVFWGVVLHTAAKPYQDFWWVMGQSMVRGVSGGY